MHCINLKCMQCSHAVELHVQEIAWMYSDIQVGDCREQCHLPTGTLEPIYTECQDQ